MVTLWPLTTRSIGNAPLQLASNSEYHMGMPAVHTDWTVDMLDALPEDGKRYEIIDGVLFVTPSPNEGHQDIVGLLHYRLYTYLSGKAIGKAMVSPSDVRRGDRNRNRVQPDVYVIRRNPDGKRPEYPYNLPDLLFAIEVASPRNRKYDYETKRDLYLGDNIAEYWVIDPVRRNVTRWRNRFAPPDVITDTIEWWPAGSTTPFVLDLPQFFHEARE